MFRPTLYFVKPWLSILRSSRSSKRIMFLVCVLLTGRQEKVVMTRRFELGAHFLAPPNTCPNLCRDLAPSLARASCWYLRPCCAVLAGPGSRFLPFVHVLFAASPHGRLAALSRTLVYMGHCCDQLLHAQSAASHCPANFRSPDIEVMPFCRAVEAGMTSSCSHVAGLCGSLWVRSRSF